MLTSLRGIGVLLLGLICASSVAAESNLTVEIHEPANGTMLTSLDREVAVVGGASIFGGVKQLDLFLVIDTSKSLKDTDPKDYRVRGSIALVRHLPTKSDIHMGVVDVDGNAEMLQPLTADRSKVAAALRGLDRHGSTDLADGIRAAMAGFQQGARPESSRIILLFTDGKSNEKKARIAMREAAAQGIAIHTLLLGKDDDGADLLRSLAEGTGGSFVQVRDPAKLPEAFLNLRTTGIERVTLSANGSPPVPAKLAGGTFTGMLPLTVGENRIVATATSLDGARREATTTVLVSDDLTVKIDSPTHGTVYMDRQTEAVVTGVATLFESMPDYARPSDPSHGVRSVVLRVDDSPGFATNLENGTFTGRVMLHDGENRILATATSLDGRVADTSILVSVRSQGCAELEVQAMRDGRPAHSLSDRGVEIVFDASNSMWAQIDGRSKMEIAKETLWSTLDNLPDDLDVALRVYGHQNKHQERNCQDSQLLVSFDATSQDAIRRAIASVKPRGQTPLGYSLEQVAADFGGYSGERAVVLVTDGIESCGGDPAAAARALQQSARIPVHVISFGLGSGEDEDAASLRAIAQASGGRFISAGSAQELRDALSTTVGTAFRVTSGGQSVVEGTLGAGNRFDLPQGEYVVEFDSQPARRVPVRLVSEEATTLIVERRGDQFRHGDERRPTEYRSCQDTLAGARRATQPAAEQESPRRSW